jgi:hypothetical protein
MLLENEPKLLRWLSLTLTDLCDADPNALAQYVVALLKHHDKKGDVLKNHCSEQLIDFLQDKTGSFLDSLFQVQKDGSYILDTLPVEDEVRNQSLHIVPNIKCHSIFEILNGIIISNILNILFLLNRRIISALEEQMTNLKTRMIIEDVEGTGEGIMMLSKMKTVTTYRNERSMIPHLYRVLPSHHSQLSRSKQKKLKVTLVL